MSGPDLPILEADEGLALQDWGVTEIALRGLCEDPEIAVETLLDLAAQGVFGEPATDAELQMLERACRTLLGLPR